MELEFIGRGTWSLELKVNKIWFHKKVITLDHKNLLFNFIFFFLFFFFFHKYSGWTFYTGYFYILIFCIILLFLDSMSIFHFLKIFQKNIIYRKHFPFLEEWYIWNIQGVSIDGLGTRYILSLFQTIQHHKKLALYFFQRYLKKKGFYLSFLFQKNDVFKISVSVGLGTHQIHFPQISNNPHSQ